MALLNSLSPTPVTCIYEGLVVPMPAAELAEIRRPLVVLALRLRLAEPEDAVQDALIALLSPGRKAVTVREVLVDPELDPLGWCSAWLVRCWRREKRRRYRAPEIVPLTEELECPGSRR